MTLADYQCLADCMASLQGKAILTINKHPDMVRIFSRFRHDVVSLNYTVGGGRKGGKKAQEIVCYNWP